MFRFFRILCLVFGLSLFGVTMLRAIQPSQTNGAYRVIYGDYHAFRCCAAFMINEDRRTANRVRVGVVEQPLGAPSSFSPSGRWRFMLVSTGQRSVPYLVPTTGGELVQLPDTVAQGWQVHWGLRQDTLYFLGRENTFASALYRLTPSTPQPERLTDFVFGGVRSIDEIPLPTSRFSPWALLFLSINVLVVGGGLKPFQVD